MRHAHFPDSGAVPHSTLDWACVAMHHSITSAATLDNVGRAGTAATSYANVAFLRSHKLSGYDSVFLHLNCYADSGTGTCNVICGAASQSFTFTTGVDKTLRIDISSIATGTAFAVTLQAKHSTGATTARVGTWLAVMSPRSDLLTPDYTLTV